MVSLDSRANSLSTLRVMQVLAAVAHSTNPIFSNTVVIACLQPPTDLCQLGFTQVPRKGRSGGTVEGLSLEFEERKGRREGIDDRQKIDSWLAGWLGR